MKSLRLQEVVTTVQTYFDRQFSGKVFWCHAEVMQAKIHKTRVYLDVVEYDASWSLIAKMKAIVWEMDLLMVYLHAHGLAWVDELIGKILVFEASCSFHAQRWLSLHIQALSHEFARWQLHLQQEQIRAYLQKEGIYEANKTTVFWLPPLRLAIISSATSEWFRDFVTILEQSPWLIEVELFSASIHGESAKHEVAAQLTSIWAQIDRFSAVIITRGGGWGEWLVWQNDQSIAEAICRLPIPVILATGHTSDRSLLDEVVWHAAKTPSDAAHLIVDGVEQMAGRLERIHEEIENKINTRLEVYAQHIDQWYTWCQLDAKRIRAQIVQTLENLWSTIQLVAPEQQTRRWYALIRDTLGWYSTKDDIKKLIAWDRFMIEIYDEKLEVQLIQRIQ